MLLCAFVGVFVIPFSIAALNRSFSVMGGNWAGAEEGEGSEASKAAGDKRVIFTGGGGLGKPISIANASSREDLHGYCDGVKSALVGVSSLR